VAAPRLSHRPPTVGCVLLERRCPGCGERSVGLCRPCAAGTVPAPPLPPVAGLDSLQAWTRYEGSGRAVVLALKHGGRRDLARWLGAELAALAPAADLVTWVPASGPGRRARGYDQGQLLARSVGRRLGRPVVGLLRRPRAVGSQQGRGRDERLAGIRFTGRRAAIARVLLVDDVATTGASLSLAARALRCAGASAVHGLVVATAGRDLRPWLAPAGGPYGVGVETGKGVPMRVTVSGRHTTVTAALRQRSEEQLARFDDFLGGLDRASVHFWEEANSRVEDRVVCEISVEGHGHHARAKVAGRDGVVALDLAVEKIEGQLRMLKTKQERRLHRRERPELPPDLVPERLVPETG
jgi:competence protein ComFC